MDPNTPTAATTVVAFKHRLDLGDPRFLVLTVGMGDGSVHGLAIVGETCRWLRDEIRREEQGGAYNPVSRLGEAQAAARVREFVDARARLPEASMQEIMSRNTVRDISAQGDREVLRLDVTLISDQQLALWLSDDLVLFLAAAIDDAVERGLQTG